MPLLKEDEVAKILRCHPVSVYRLRKAGKLPFIRGPGILIRSEDVDKYIRVSTVKMIRRGVLAPPVKTREDLMKAAVQKGREIARSIRRPRPV